MTQIPNKKFILLSRKNRGKRELPEYIQKLNTALGGLVQENDFFSIEETDEIIHLFKRNYEEHAKSNSLLCNENDIETLYSQVKNLKQLFGSSKGYLITKFSEFCGVNIISINECLENFDKIIAIDGDSMGICLIDKKSGLLIDYFEDYIDGKPVWFYEFCHW